MTTLELSRFREINAIIERDSKDTTYKFALLRAVSTHQRSTPT
jgi:hypothetical protein